MIPKSLEDKRDEIAKIIIEYHACLSGDCSHHSQKECDLTVLAHSFEAGAKAVLESAELKDLSAALNITLGESCNKNCSLYQENFVCNGNCEFSVQALTNWNEFIGEKK